MFVLGLLAPDGGISSALLRTTITAGNVLCVGAGIWFLRRLPSGWGNVALALCVGALTLATVEVIAVVTGVVVPGEAQARQRAVHLYDHDPELGLRVRPHLTDFEMHLPGHGHSVRYDTDARGLRNVGRDYDAARLWFVGDSFTFGEWVERDSTFFGRLERRLGEPAISLGIPAADVTQYAVQVERHLPALRATVLGICIFANDLKQQPSDEWLRSWYSSYRDSYGRIALREKLVSLRLMRHTANLLFRDTTPARHFVAPNGTVLHREFGPRPNYFRDSLFVETEAQINRTIDLALRTNVQPVIFLFPSKESTHHTTFTDWLGSDALAIEEEGYRRICNIAASRGVPCYDLTAAFREADERAPLYFREDGHWNARGHELAEREMAKPLAALLNR